MKKKDILFYTFLGIFIITAGITLLGITGKMTIREGYLNTLVGLFLLESGGAVISLFRNTNFFDEEHKPKQQGPMEVEPAATPKTVEQPATPPAPQVPERCDSPINSEAIQQTATKQEEPTSNVEEPPTKKQCDLSAAEFFKRIEELNGRFHEQEEFIEAQIGSDIRWGGVVTETSSSRLGKTVNISLSTGGNYVTPSFVAAFPIDMKAKAFALRQGDWVVVTGTLQTVMGKMFAEVKGFEFQRTERPEQIT